VSKDSTPTRIWRLAIYTQEDGHQGYHYYPSKVAAERVQRDLVNLTDYVDSDFTIKSFPYPKTPKQLFLLLREVAGHADNG
jgi:hypothetical protein